MARDTNLGSLSDLRCIGAPLCENFVSACQQDPPICCDRQPFLGPFVRQSKALELLTIGALVEQEVITPHLASSRERVRHRTIAGNPLTAAAFARDLERARPPHAQTAPEAHRMAVPAHEDRGSAGIHSADTGWTTRTCAKEPAHPWQSAGSRSS